MTRDRGENKGKASIEKSIATWIDDSGEIHTEKFNADVVKLHDSLMMGKKKK